MPRRCRWRERRAFFSCRRLRENGGEASFSVHRSDRFEDDHAARLHPLGSTRSRNFRPCLLGARGVLHASASLGAHRWHPLSTKFGIRALRTADNRAADNNLAVFCSSPEARRNRVR
jgi:hypothetical protein